MTVYWIDSSVLIQSRHKFHPRERVPKFWQWLDGQLDAGTIRMPHRAYKEVTDGNDWLVKWCKDRRNKGLDVPMDSDIEDKYREISAYVQTKHKHVQHQITEFLRGADGWVIAYAWAKKGVAVSEEDKARRHETSSIKIPNVCGAKNVKWLDTFGVLDVLKARF